MQRRDFFGSFASGFRGTSSGARQEIAVRPPYYSDGSLFHSECQQCDARCGAACEEGIIRFGEDKIPYLSFKEGGCTYCDACAQACSYGVLTLQEKKRIEATVEIDPLKCVAWHDTICFSCKDPCLENAILFQGLFKPLIDDNRCTACGFCISRCPSEALGLGGIS